MLNPEESPSNKAGAPVLLKLIVSFVIGCEAMLGPYFTDTDSLPRPITSSYNLLFGTAAVLTVGALYNLYDQVYPTGKTRYSRSCGEKDTAHLESIDRVTTKALGIVKHEFGYPLPAPVPESSQPLRINPEFQIKDQSAIITATNKLKHVGD